MPRTGQHKDMKFHDFEVSTDKTRYEMQIKAASKNPCVKIGPVTLAPNLDFEGKIIVALADDQVRAIVTFDGNVEMYPAFEMYASVNDGQPEMVFQMGVAPEAGVSELAGRPERIVTGKAELHA